MEIRSYRDLDVWMKSMALVEIAYRCTAEFPAHQRYSLANQLERASVSIPANIAEGHASAHTKEFLRHISIALGSLAEVETLVLIAGRLGYASNERRSSILSEGGEIGRMLRRLQQSVRRRLSVKTADRNPNP